MNNQGKSAFFLRHSEDTKLIGGEKAYEEDFYLNQQPSFSDRGGLRFFAYGDCLWRSRFRQDLQHRRSFWAFEFVTEGDGIFKCESIRYNLRPGDLYIIRPEGTISVRPGPSGFLRKKCVSLQSSLIDCMFGNLQAVNVIRSENPLRLENIYAKIRQLILSHGKFVHEEIESQSYALLVELNRLAMPAKYPLPLCRALDLIKSNLHLEYKLDSLSAESKVGISTLSRLFRRHLKISPIDYIIDRRLEYAKQLIKVSNMPMKEVAERCGYNSESFFSRSFKKKFGISPNSYRRS
jgi:AraC-like DNA-binding protein